nr:copia protein [Tanacetum cinerariifolium]
MQEELLQFSLPKVWRLVDLPYKKKAIETKWLYMNKKDERGIVVRNKARLVAKGHIQEEATDYDEVFAPLARIKAIRIFLDFALYMGFIFYQMDVKSNFLYGTIEEEVYFCQPLGFIDPEFPNKVYKIPAEFHGGAYILLRTAGEADTPIETQKPLVKDEEAADVTPKLTHLHAVKSISRILISWQCKKQTIVVTSTTEAKYVVAANCCGQFVDRVVKILSSSKVIFVLPLSPDYVLGPEEPEQAPLSLDYVPGLEEPEQAPLSPDYVPGPEELEQVPLSPNYVPGPKEPEQAPPLSVYLPYVPDLMYPEYMPLKDDVFPAEEQSLPVAATPTADSPGYIPEFDPNGDPEEDEEEDPEEGPAYYPTDFTVVALPTVDHVPSEEFTEPLPQILSPPLPIPSPPPDSPTHIEIAESCLALRKRLCFASPTPSQEVRESLAARAARQNKPAIARDDPYSLVRDELYGFVDRVDVAPKRLMSRELGYGITDT